MRTHIIYRKELFAKVILYLCVCGGTGIVLLNLARKPWLPTFALIAMVAPLLLMPALLRSFTREMYIDIKPGGFELKVFDKRGERIQVIELSQLDSYTIQIPNDKFVSIRFIRNGARTIELSFFQQKKELSDEDTSEVISSIRKSILDYNSRPGINKQITLQPSFYASNAGLYTIVALSAVLLAGILAAAYWKGKSVPVAFAFGSILVLQMVLRRRKELQRYNNER